MTQIGNTELLTSTAIAGKKIIMGQNKFCDSQQAAIQHRGLLLQSLWVFCVLKAFNMFPLNMTLFLNLSFGEVTLLGLNSTHHVQIVSSKTKN